MTDTSTTAGSRLKDQVGQIAGIAGEKLADLKRAGMEKAAQLQEGSSEVVRKNPMMSLAIALGIGLLAGHLLARRR